MNTEWADCCAPDVRLPDTTRGETECVLLSDWTVSVRGHTFAAGTTTDGASIPRFLWRICGHPYQVPRAYAALLHDWLYRNGKNICIFFFFIFPKIYKVFYKKIINWSYITYITSFFFNIYKI